MGADNVHGRIARVKASRSYPASVNEPETITAAKPFYGHRSGGCPWAFVPVGGAGDASIDHVERS